MINKARFQKCITCHAGSRDGYQVSIALYENDLLDCLVTDFYSPDLFRKWIGKRYSNSLPSKKVISLWRNVISQKLFRQSFFDSDRILSNFALKKAFQHKSNLFLSSYTAYEAFSGIKNNGLQNRCLLFQIHPHPNSIRKILEDEIQLVPIAKNSILGELEMDKNENAISRLTQESHLADAIVVASSFTKRTLIENSIPEKKITVIPYGVDFNNFPAKKNYQTNNGKLHIVFIGQMIQRKGLFYLLEALKCLNSAHITLTIVGRGSIDHDLLNQYVSRYNIKLKFNLSQKELIEEIHNNDVLVFPSLIEGFGHVVLEAMSAGLPVICTPNTAGPDLFLTGNEGFIVPIRSTETLAEKIEWCLLNKSHLKEMGEQAAKTARIFTWQKFRQGISNFYQCNADNMN